MSIRPPAPNRCRRPSPTGRGDTSGPRWSARKPRASRRRSAARPSRREVTALLYEMRLYQCGMGRMQDVSDRLRDFVPRRSGSTAFGSVRAMVRDDRSFPFTSGCWRGRNPDVRAKAFGDLWADPDFQTLRTRTNGAREMVLRYDIYLMH